MHRFTGENIVFQVFETEIQPGAIREESYNIDIIQDCIEDVTHYQTGYCFRLPQVKEVLKGLIENGFKLSNLIVCQDEDGFFEVSRKHSGDTVVSVLPE